MSFFIYPTRKRPQFYFTDRTNVVNYFIDNFFYLRRSEFQFLITVIKLFIPAWLIRLFVVLILKKENNLPAEISAEIGYLIEFIKTQRIIFMPYFNDHPDISCIIRKSKWDRADDKFVVIFFSGDDIRPLTVAKVSRISNEASIKKEYRNLELVHDKFKDIPQILIPEPIALHTSDETITYFEAVIDGIPFSDYQKLFVRKKKMQHLYIDILEKCKNMLISLHLQRSLLTREDFSKYFYEPIDTLNKNQFANMYHSKLLQLKEEIHSLEKVRLPSVWMHGDFWLGSILYNSGKLGFIDWEFFSERGVPLWDYFSLIFHIGTRNDYFSDPEIWRKVDNHLLDLAAHCQIDKIYIPVLFQCFLLFNIQTRDTSAEKYWQTMLENYWNALYSTRNKAGRLL